MKPLKVRFTRTYSIDVNAWRQRYGHHLTVKQIRRMVTEHLSIITLDDEIMQEVEANEDGW